MGLASTSTRRETDLDDTSSLAAVGRAWCPRTLKDCDGAVNEIGPANGRTPSSYRSTFCFR